MHGDILSNFPPNWEVVTIEPFTRKLLYGFGCNLENLSYGIYATDFKDVWSEQLSNLNIIERANSYGIEDLYDEKVRLLLSTLAENFNFTTKGRDLDFSFSSSYEISHKASHIAIKSNEKVNWEFSLEILSPENAASFFSKYALQQHENQVYLHYHVQNLDRIIDEKDRYIDYLATNYKAINGDELMRKYIRNNKYATKYIGKHDSNYWDTRTKVLYQRNARAKILLPMSPDRVWNSTTRVISNKKVLESTSEIMAMCINHPSASERASLKRESELHDSKPTIKRQVKQEFDTVHLDRKPRARLGIIGLRKRKSA